MGNAADPDHRPTSVSGHRLTGAIDCDVHPAVPDTRVLLPYLDDYWREHILRRGLERENLEADWWRRFQVSIN